MPVIAFKDFGAGTGEKNVKTVHSSILKINPCDLVLHRLVSTAPAVKWLFGTFLYSQIKPLDKQFLALFLVHRGSFCVCFLNKHQRREFPPL